MILLLLSQAGCGKKSDKSSVTNATKVNLAGCSNLYKVNDHLYRGAQPEDQGFHELAKHGIKTIVNLRQHHSDRKLIGETKLDYAHIKMQAWDPEHDEVMQFLRIATDKDKQPVFVHCQHGSDRTGTMIAVYRIIVDGWTKDKALNEMTKGPFGFHKVWKGLPKFINDLDVEKTKKDLDKNNELPALTD